MNKLSLRIASLLLVLLAACETDPEGDPSPGVDATTDTAEGDATDADDTSDDADPDAAADASEDTADDVGEDTGEDAVEDAGEDTVEDAGEDAGEDVGEDTTDDTDTTDAATDATDAATDTTDAATDTTDAGEDTTDDTTDVATDTTADADSTCDTDDECGDGAYCALVSCAAPGACADRPVACVRVWDPVCGCDGETYSNACFAASAGVSVEHAGECGCDSNLDCNESDYCAADSCDGRGSCEPRPEICTRVYAPVCGCDGETYSNECIARSAGVNVAYVGECEAEGCRSNRDCDLSDYCYFETGCTGVGECVSRPDACIAIYDPVCGCSGTTYGNSCEAAAAGQNVDYTGACGATD